MKRFELKNKIGDIDISEDELIDIALLGSEMLQGIINDFLRTGCPIPLPEGYQNIYLLTTDPLIYSISFSRKDFFTV